MGIRAPRRKQPDATYCIEGEYVTAEQIGNRVGLTTSTVHDKLKRLRTLPGAITWEALAASPQPPGRPKLVKPDGTP